MNVQKMSTDQHQRNEKYWSEVKKSLKLSSVRAGGDSLALGIPGGDGGEQEPRGPPRAGERERPHQRVTLVPVRGWDPQAPWQGRVFPLTSTVVVNGRNISPSPLLMVSGLSLGGKVLPDAHSTFLTLHAAQQG